MDSCIKETTRLRYAQNSRAAVSRLPTELLADVFLRIVESGLRDGDTRFVTGTFCFLQVCRRWNEVAVSFPLLWGWWVAGAVRAWPLFNSRSRDVPLFLMWRPQLPDSARDVLMDPTITSKRIRQLDFSGTNEQLVQLLDAFDSNPPSNASSIRIQIFPFDRRYHRKSDDPRGHIARFLSPPFPRLARLDLENILPNPSSPIFTTSNLISLKLSILYARENRYTPSQLLQILRQHPNLQELDLNHDAIPLPGPPSAPVSFVLPRLADLRLYGSEAAILGFIDLIGMSSPLHNVIVCFELNRGLTIPGLASTVKEMLVAYYECQGLNYSRTVDHLIISYDSGERYLAFNTRSHSVPTSNLGLKANLRLQFNGVLPDDAMATEIFPLFPLHDLQEFTAEGQVIYGCRYRGMFQKMKNLSHLRLENLDIRPVLGALSSGSQGLSQRVTNTTPIHPHTHRRTVWRNHPGKAGVINRISP